MALIACGSLFLNHSVVAAEPAPADASSPAPAVAAEATTTALPMVAQSGPPFQEEAVEWDQEAGTKVFFPEKGEPHVTLSGKLKEGNELFFNDIAVELTDGRFSIPVKLMDSANDYTIRLKIPEVGENIYRFTYTWKKLPPEKQFKVKIREGGQVVEKATAAVTKVQESEDWIEATPTLARRAGRAFLKQFEGQGMLVTDSLGGLVISVAGGWSPEYRINRRWTLGAGLNVMLFKNKVQEFFPAIEYRLSLARKFGKGFEFEILGGAQSWFGVQALIPMVGANFIIPRKWLIPDWPFFKLGRKLFIGYSYIFHQSQAHLFRLGGRLAF